MWVSSKLVLAITLIMIHQTKSTFHPFAYFCNNDTMFANNSAYQTNLNTLFRSLTTNATNNPSGYHRATINNPKSEPIYGHYLCRADQNTSTCHECVTLATTVDLPKTYCPNRKIANIWYDECMVRYSNASFFDKMDRIFNKIYWNVNNIIGNTTDYLDARNKMLNSVVTRAAQSEIDKKYATDFTNYSIIQPIYGMGQCTPDLSDTDCYMCLNASIAMFRTDHPGGRVLAASCFLRYEYYPFFNLSYLQSPSPPPQASPSLPSSRSSSSGLNPDKVQRGKKNVSTKLLVSMFIALLVFIAAIFSLCICILKHKSKRTDTVGHIETGTNDQDFTVETLQYDLATLVTATNSFSDENKLGEGGFGAVYKGKLPNGRLIAVKRLCASSSQGMQEFKTEVLVVANLQHRNLVRLLGYCYTEREKLLVYEYVANKSLDNFLFDQENRSQLDWQRRYNIIRGIARGLLYLHHDSQLRIIHRDLKASNVLLDEKMNPKISDFGTSRIFGVDHSKSNYTSRVVGTYGYMAPEYAYHGQFSIKSDAYSFGVLVLEIISGRKNTSTFNVPGGALDFQTHAWRQWQARTPLDFVDPIIRDCSNSSEVMRCIHLGLLCIQESIEDRPTMASVVLTLDSYSVTLPIPEQPALFAETRLVSTIPKDEAASDHLSSKSTPLSVNDASISELEPR